MYPAREQIPTREITGKEGRIWNPLDLSGNQWYGPLNGGGCWNVFICSWCLTKRAWDERGGGRERCMGINK